MANIIYPDGVSGFAVLAAATAIPFAATVLGSIGLGDGKPADGQKAAMGVVFQFTVDANSTTSIDIKYEGTKDGTNWFSMDEYDFAITAGMIDTNFRKHVQPFTHGANAIRVIVFGNGSSPEGTIAIQAHLTGLFEVVGGV